MSQSLNLDPILRQANLLCQSQFGRSPEQIRIYTHEHAAVIWLHELIDPADYRLPDDPDECYSHIYILLSQFIFPALQKKIQSILDKKVANVFIDWKEKENDAVIAAVFDTDSASMYDESYKGKAEIHNQVSEITRSVQKTPESIQSYWLTDDILVVLRRGLMIKLEKQIVQKGFNNELRVSKRQLELEHFFENLSVADILGRTLDTAYLDWDFKHDFSMMLLFLRK